MGHQRVRVGNDTAPNDRNPPDVRRVAEGLGIDENPRRRRPANPVAWAREARI